MFPLAIERIAECVARLTLVGPTADDLNRARTLLTARWARRLEPMEGKASALASAEALEHVSFLDREYAALVSLDAGRPCAKPPHGISSPTV